MFSVSITDAIYILYPYAVATCVGVGPRNPREV